MGCRALKLLILTCETERSEVNSKGPDIAVKLEGASNLRSAECGVHTHGMESRSASSSVCDFGAMSVLYYLLRISLFLSVTGCISLHDVRIRNSG